MKRVRVVIFTLAAGAASCAQDHVQPTRVPVTDQQIAQIQRLIRVTEDDDPQKPDFYFRLAQLHAVRPSPLPALTAYIEVIAYPAYARRDEALWEAAGILRSAGRPEEARIFLRRLIDEHPRSRHVPAATTLLLQPSP